MHTDLQTRHFATYPQFISSELAESLGEQILAAHASQHFFSDAQIPGSPCFENLPFLVDFHHASRVKAEAFVEEPLLPTYVYGRIYKHGDVLAPHRDRDACEISLTLNLRSDLPWSIWFDTPTKEVVEVALPPGHAAFYRGCDAMHWRSAFRGEQCIQVFLHYVLRDGDRAWCAKV